MFTRFDNTSARKLEKAVMTQDELISTHIQLNEINEEIIGLKDQKINDMQKVIDSLEEQIRLLSEIIDIQKEMLRIFGF